MMKQTAFERGVHAAGFFKRFSKTVRLSNDACLNWVHKKELPEILGRLPVPIAIFCLLITALLCGLLIGSIIALAAMFIYMLCNITISEEDDYSDDHAPSYGTEWRNGSEGTGIYTGPEHGPGPSYRVDIEDEED